MGDGRRNAYAHTMANAWNFERRTVVRARFLVGVWLVAKGAVNVATSLEAVRNRMRLPPEDALFAARMLDSEQLIGFEPGGAVKSTAGGITRVIELLASAKEQARRVDDATRVVRTGGIPLEMLKLALLVEAGSLACESPERDLQTDYRLVLVGDKVTIERKGANGEFEPVTEPE